MEGQFEAVSTPGLEIVDEVELPELINDHEELERWKIQRSLFVASNVDAHELPPNK